MGGGSDWKGGGEALEERRLKQRDRVITKKKRDRRLERMSLSHYETFMLQKQIKKKSQES